MQHLLAIFPSSITHAGKEWLPQKFRYTHHTPEPTTVSEIMQFDFDTQAFPTTLNKRLISQNRDDSFIHPTLSSHWFPHSLSTCMSSYPCHSLSPSQWIWKPHCKHFIFGWHVLHSPMSLSLQCPQHVLTTICTSAHSSVINYFHYYLACPCSTSI